MEDIFVLLLFSVLRSVQNRPLKRLKISSDFVATMLGQGSRQLARDSLARSFAFDTVLPLSISKVHVLVPMKFVDTYASTWSSREPYVNTSASLRTATIKSNILGGFTIDSFQVSYLCF